MGRLCSQARLRRTACSHRRHPGCRRRKLRRLLSRHRCKWLCDTLHRACRTPSRARPDTEQSSHRHRPVGHRRLRTVRRLRRFCRRRLRPRTARRAPDRRNLLALCTRDRSHRRRASCHRRSAHCQTPDRRRTPPSRRKARPVRGTGSCARCACNPPSSRQRSRCCRRRKLRRAGGGRRRNLWCPRRACPHRSARAAPRHGHRGRPRSCQRRAGSARLGACARSHRARVARHLPAPRFRRHCIRQRRPRAMLRGERPSHRTNSLDCLHTEAAYRMFSKASASAQSPRSNPEQCHGL
jgi:hypothetical protein